MHRDEVEVGRLQTYSYWIISYLHSIHVATKIYILSVISRCMATKHLYTTRNARILVDCPTKMCIELSRMTNIESHNVMRNAPYLEQLQQLRDQRISFGSPPKPQQGLPKSSPQRVPWEVWNTTIACNLEDLLCVIFFFILIFLSFLFGRDL